MTKKIFKCVLGLVLLFGTAIASEDTKSNNNKRVKYTMNSQEGGINLLDLPNDIVAKIFSSINMTNMPSICKTLENVRVESFCIKTGEEPNTYTVINENNWLKYIRNIHKYGLKNLIICGVSGEILKGLIPELTDITALWIESNEFHPSVENYKFQNRKPKVSFIAEISKLTNLEHLTLVDTRFTERKKNIQARIVNNYVPEIKYLTNLESLFIKNYHFSTENSINELATEIKDLPCLTCLSLPNNAINPKSFKTILVSGVNWSSLTSLDLGGNDLKSLGEEDLESIRCIPNLKYKDDKQDNNYTYVSRNIIQNICGKRMETFLDTLVKAVQDKNECEYPMGITASKLYFDFEDIEWFIDEVAAEEIGKMISNEHYTIERINLYPKQPKLTQKTLDDKGKEVLVTRLFYNLYYDGDKWHTYPYMNSVGDVELNRHYSDTEGKKLYQFKLTTYNKDLYSWPVAIG